MELTLSLDHYRRYISLNTDSIIYFESSDIDENIEGTYPNGIIDIFLAIEKLLGKGKISNLDGYDSIQLYPGENRRISIGNSHIFNEIKIQGRGQRIQEIQINGFEGNINITHCKPLDLLLLKNNFGEVTIEKDLEINKIDISGNGKKFTCKNLKILNELTVNGLDVSNDLALENIVFFSDADGGTKFNIYGSTIGKLSLKDLDLPKAGLLISNSKISEAYFYKTNLEKLKLIGVTGKGFGNLIKENNVPSEMKEFYRQLKHSHDEIGNKTEANKFFAKEMEYHMISLKDIKDWKNYGIALLQKEVSDFGQDWIRALIIYFIVCLLGFNFAQLSQITLNWILNKDLFQSGIVVWNEFVRYLNPLPKTDEVPGLWYLLVSIVKLLLVYQITVALRRISQR